MRRGVPVPRPGRAPVAAALALVISCAAAPAHAWDPQELTGISARATGLAGAMSAGADDAAAALFNPAGAALASGPEIAVGWTYGALRLKLDGHGARVTDPHGAHVAAALPLARGDFAVALGLALYLPDQYLMRIQLVPPSEPHFGLLDNDPQRLVANAVLALRWRWLAVGAGVSVLVDAAGRGITLDVGLSAGEKVGQASLDYGLPSRVAPFVGVMVTPGRRLRLAATYRGDVDLRQTLAVLANVDVAGVVTGDATITLRAVNFFTPKRLALGARLELRDDLALLADLVYFRWSEMSGGAPDLRVIVHLGVSPPLVTALFPPDGFRDTLSLRVGAEHARPLGRRHRLRLRGGFAWEPSPVPDQRGLRSVADNDRLVFGLGAGVDLRDPSGVLRRPFSLEAGLQWQHLLERTTLKSTVGLGPGLRSGGDIAVVSVSATVRF